MTSMGQYDPWQVLAQFIMAYI